MTKPSWCMRTGKQCLTKSEAKSAAKRVAPYAKGPNLVAYRCGLCKGWHVGNRRRF